MEVKRLSQTDVSFVEVHAEKQSGQIWAFFLLPCDQSQQTPDRQVSVKDYTARWSCGVIAQTVVNLKSVQNVYCNCKFSTQVLHKHANVFFFLSYKKKMFEAEYISTGKFYAGFEINDFHSLRQKKMWKSDLSFKVELASKRTPENSQVWQSSMWNLSDSLAYWSLCISWQSGCPVAPLPLKSQSLIANKVIIMCVVCCVGRSYQLSHILEEQ